MVANDVERRDQYVGLIEDGAAVGPDNAHHAPVALAIEVDERGIAFIDQVAGVSVELADAFDEPSTDTVPLFVDGGVVDDGGGDEEFFSACPDRKRRREQASTSSE